MAGYEVIADLGRGRSIVRMVGGPHHGVEVVLVPGPIRGVEDFAAWAGDGVRETTSPSSRAQALLESLLSEEQRADWAKRRRFMVGTPFGDVELGKLYDIGFWPTSGGEFRLCVLPKGHQELPKGDVWASLLLCLRGDPEWFFTVANWHRPNEEWNFGPVPFEVGLGT